MRLKYGESNINIEKGKKGFQRSLESNEHWSQKKTGYSLLLKRNSKPSERDFRASFLVVF